MDMRNFEATLGADLFAAAILLVLCFTFASSVSASTVLTFDEPPVAFQDGYSDGDQYTESGYFLSSVSDPGHNGALIRFNPNTQITQVPNNGTVHFGITAFANPWLQRIDNGIFNLVSLDVARYSRATNFVDTARLVGHRADGSQIEAILSLPPLFLDEPPGGREDFSNYVLNWDGLVRVDFASFAFAFDNVEVAVVPLPAGIWLFGSALGLLGCMWRKAR